ncbi:hypothetical protein GPECTOR_2138g1116 [Gonium pectorale]|uniref:Uncharacterized protein n=1 Tax=Gonium pectorale TaxID=33097 RepID=A0A150FT68_GONPE|nr:hypothetical protein GPECTOR_2138g1116 [Gonium pectorale]|eukprot:KXZ40817.1 hypothetical protein GPECTOR_2138g1116 [Gonium pectorale]
MDPKRKGMEVLNVARSRWLIQVFKGLQDRIKRAAGKGAPVPAATGPAEQAGAEAGAGPSTSAPAEPDQLPLLPGVEVKKYNQQQCQQVLPRVVRYFCHCGWRKSLTFDSLSSSIKEGEPIPVAWANAHNLLLEVNNLFAVEGHIKGASLSQLVTWESGHKGMRGGIRTGGGAAAAAAAAVACGTSSGGEGGGGDVGGGRQQVGVGSMNQARPLFLWKASFALVRLA